MPYQRSTRLPGERASRLGHLEVLQSDLVNRLCDSFENMVRADGDTESTAWQQFDTNAEPLTTVFGIDGSLQAVESETRPRKTLAFVKTAMLRLDEYALARVDKTTPHPFVLRDILKQSAIYHATVFPLRNMSLPGVRLYDAVRQIIYESLQDPTLNGEPFETLKWLVYEKWSGEHKSLPLFGCPHCEENNATLPYDANEGSCPVCGGHLFVTDMLGFHLDMSPDAVSDSVASAYMNIHETLLLFTGIRYFWQTSRHVLERCLFVKDGPLSIRAQYSKLVAPIRRFLAYSYAQNSPIYIIGQEKTGRFVDHLSTIADDAADRSIFVPDDSYIKLEIQNRSVRGAPYGRDTNYGAKVFVKTNQLHRIVISIPTSADEFLPYPQPTDLIGIGRILATLPRILSNKYDGALLPIELAHNIASLSSYPSAQILRLFADAKH